MTTVAEIRKWTRPLFERRADITLRGRAVIVVPIKHVHRYIWFMGSSDKADPYPWWQFSLPFTPPRLGGEGNWSASIPVGKSTEPNFIGRLTEQFLDKIENDLAPICSVEAFYERLSERQRLGATRDFGPLSRVPGQHAVVLAALGRLKEAQALIDGLVALQEPHRLAQLVNGQALVAKRSNSAIGRMDIESATADLKLLSELKHLASLTQANDRVGVAALLHRWEEANIKRWKHEDLWEPTPFPIELGAGN